MGRRSADVFEEALANELLRDVDNSVEQTLIAKADLLVARATPVQAALIEDPSKRKAARCPRRAGKTTAATFWITDHLCRNPGAIAWYVATTLKQARRLIWNAVRRISRELDLKIRFQKSEATAVWPNEAQLWLAGADDRGSIHDMLGHAPSIGAIDECAAFAPHDFDYLINEVLEPSLMDNDGSLLLISTPGHTLAGLYYEVTGPTGTLIEQFDSGKRALARPYNERRKPKWRGVAHEWSLHAWTLAENTARPDLWRKALALRRKRGWADDSPIWRRQYLGQWTEADPAERVFVYDEARDCWDPLRREDGFAILPKEHEWRFLIGMDLGSTDPLAIQVAAFSFSSDLLLHCYEWEAPHLSITELGRKLLEVVEMCGGLENVEDIVSDHEQLGDTILRSLSDQFGLFVEKGSKKEKWDHIEMTNTELKDGRAKIMKGSKLAAEMIKLRRDDRRPGKTKGSPNNNTDAYLYLSTRARDRNTREPTVVSADRAAELRKERQREEQERFLATRRRRQNSQEPSLEVDWNSEEW